MDENKIEITVELDTGNIEKQIDRLNGKLVDGASQATKEYAKMRNSVSKSLSGIHDKINNSTKKITESVKKSATSVKSLIQQAIPFASLYAIFDTLKNGISSFVDSGETTSKFATVMGSNIEEATKWVDELTSSVAVSKTELMDASSSMMAIGKSMGMTGDEAYKMATSMSELAIDMDSFYNRTDSLDKVRSAMTGEYEPLKALGIILTEDSVKAKALAMGLDATSNSSKMLARQALITEQMMASGAFGDAERTAGSLSNQLKMLRNNFEMLRTSIGSCFAGLLQVVLPVLNRIVVAVTNAFNSIASVINAIFGVFGIKIGGGSSGGGAVGDAVGDITDSLGSGLDGAGGDLADNLSDGANSAKKIVKGLMGIDELNVLSSDKGSGGSGGSGGSSGGSIGGSDVTVSDSSAFKDKMGEVEEWIKTLANNLKSVWESFKDGFLSVSDYINKSIENLKKSFANLGKSIKEFLIGAWNNGGEELIYNFGRLVGAITGAVTDIGGQCVQMVADLFSHLNPSKNKYTRAFLDGLNKLLVACQDFVLSVGGWFKKFVDNGGQAFLNVMGDITMILGTTLAKTFENIIKWVKSFMDSWVGQKTIELCAKTLDVLAGCLKAVLIVVEKLSPVWSALLSAFIINTTVSKTVTFFKDLKTVIGTVGEFIKLQFTTGVIGSLGNALNSIKTFVYSTINAFNLMKQGLVGASLAQEVGKLPALIATVCSSISAWAVSVQGATVAQTAWNVALSIGDGLLAILTSPITLIVGAIVALVAIVDVICQKFFNWEGIISWLGEKLGWLWNKIKSFFGWDGGENEIVPELEYTGYVMEETSDRFGTSCNAINKSLASIGIDTNKLALQLDKAEKMFNEKFNMISKTARDYLQAIADGNEDVLKEMSGDSDKYTAEIKSAFKDMSVEEQAIFYSTYGEIEGVTDGWLDYTKGSYEECLIKHAGMLEQINKDEKLTYDEKKKRIEDERKAFVNAQNEKIREFNLAIAEIESAEGISEEQRYSLVKEYTAKRDKLIQDMESYQLGSIDTVDDAVEVSTKTQKDAYNNVGSEQEKALKNVDTSLKETKKQLVTFKTESNNVAKEIPKAWQGIGQKIGQEFTNALNSVKNSFTGILSNTRNQCTQLKDGLQKTFNEVKNGVKSSMGDVNTTITSKFNQAVNSVKNSGNGLKTSLQNIFQSISSGLSKSFDGIKNTMSSSFKSVSATVTSTMNSCKSSMSNALSSVVSVVKDKTNNIKNTVSNNFKSISQAITKPFTDAKGSVSNSLNTVSNSISSKMDSIVKKIKSCASSMKSAMNFNFPTPYMRMPHIKVTGNWNFEKKTVPKFSVSWYSSGAIFNKRTILGGIGVGDAYKGVGNNAEAILPLDRLWDEMDKRFAQQNKVLSNNNNNGGDIHITLTMDGKEIARGVYNNQKEMTKLGQMDWDFL